MSVRSAMVLVRLSLLFFLAGSPFVPLLARLFPGQVVPIVLAGALVVGVPPGIVLARALRTSRQDELAARYRDSERFFFLAAAASQVGVIMASLGRGVVGAIGLILSAGGMLAANGLLLRASPAGSRRDSRYLAPLDPGRLE